MADNIKVILDPEEDIVTTMDSGSIQFGQLEIGETITGEEGTEAIVTNSGSSSRAILNFTIPRGAKGEKGIDGTVSFDELTEEQRLSLKGEKGDKGDTGEQGIQGIPGEKGLDGAIQYVAGENITIEGNVISATGGGTNIPTKTSQLENDSGFITGIPGEYITETELNEKGYLTEHQDLSGKQDVLVSGENIKTINGNSILGNGDIEIQGGGIAEIPIASAETLGGIKVGANLSITEDGTLNAIASSGGGSGADDVPINSIVEYDGTTVPDGWVEVEDEEDYTLPIASTETLGGIKVGANLTISEDGTLSAIAGSGGGSTGTNYNLITNGEGVKAGYQVDGKDVYVRLFDFGVMGQPGSSGAKVVKTGVQLSSINIVDYEGWFSDGNNSVFKTYYVSETDLAVITLLGGTSGELRCAFRGSSTFYTYNMYLKLFYTIN